MEWEEEVRRRVAHAIKKVYVQKRVVHKKGSRGRDIESITYLPTMVLDIDDEVVLAALRDKFTTRHLRTGKKDGIVWGRRVKKILEILFDNLSPFQKELATIILAFPSGRGKRDVKEKLYTQFYAKLEEIHRLQRLNEGGPTLQSVWVCDSPNPQVIEGGSSTTRLEIDEQYVLDVIEGLIFSDAHVSKPPGSHFVLGTTNRQYVEQVYRILHPMLSCRLNRFRDKTIKRKRKWFLHATSPKMFREFRKRWYDEGGIKRLPEDFNWTPVKLNVAYCGDGSLSGGTPGFCFHSFNERDVKRLVKSFEALGVFGVLHEVRPKQFYFRIMQDCAETFFDYIGYEPVIPCYLYKWQFREPTTRSLNVATFSEQDLKALVGEIRDLRLRRTSRGAFEITLLFGVTEVTRKLLSDFQRQNQIILYGMHAQRLLAQLLPYVIDDTLRERYKKVVEFPLRRHFTKEKEQMFVSISK